MVMWNAARTKVQLRLAVQRLRGLEEKKEALAKKARRDIATLLEKGKVDTAKLRVETMINEDLSLELLELLELYCELLVARFGILDMNTREPDPAINEAVCSIIHAAPRTEVKELHVLREMLTHKYGRDFTVGVMENQDNCVNDRVMKKLDIRTPPDSLVNAYLEEIAKGYKIGWKANPTVAVKDDDDGPSGGLKVNHFTLLHAIWRLMSLSPNETTAQSELEPALTTEPPIKYIDSSEKSSIPPSLPPTEDEKPAGKASPPPPADEDDIAALQRRFAALKKR
ncbi:hypothetical protein FRB96_008379 [Tulasnella sp. 330]|nr:hypothetical protein FRB96_008379 [Tulasnella sp. 330]